MRVIISHVNTDFDALASMVAANKIYPDAQLILSDKQTILVKQFLNIYRDTFNFLHENQINWDDVEELILVDVASLSRVGNFADEIRKRKIKITVYDHHPRREEDVSSKQCIIEQVGSTVTLLVEQIVEQNIHITPFEATLFGLGIYTDTGFFTYKNTTTRDFKAASFLMDSGMNLEMIQQFTEQTLQPEQQQLLDKLFIEARTYEVDGLQVVITSCQHNAFLGGLATLTEKLLELKSADAVIVVVGMKKNVFVVGRASSERISLLPLLEKFNGGGHKHAGSAIVKNADRLEILNRVNEEFKEMLQPAVTAKDIMASPVKTITPDTTIEEAGALMYRYKHSGYPVVKEDKLLGIVTRRDLDKAKHHGLGHAPVKAYMTTNIITIDETATLEEIQKIIIDHNIGRLPVVHNEKLLGIISRTDIIQAIHSRILMASPECQKNNLIKSNLKADMEKQLNKDIFLLLKDIGQVAEIEDVSVYLIGGIVRDIFLDKSNDDIDIVVEGNGIEFAKSLQSTYGGDLICHESFGTATWTTTNNLSIDIASARLEFYERPASLPDVELSTLIEDLYRRDFTINAMGICLNDGRFGEVIDHFNSQIDLNNQTIKVLHNLSFIEDPTRILRAIRFELRFSFLMDEQTEQLALNSIEKVTELSGERISNELKRLFNEQNAAKAIKRLFELNFWQQFNVCNDNLQRSSEHAERIQQLLKNKQTNKLFNEKPNWFFYFSIPFYYENNLNDLEKFALTKKDAKLLQEISSLKKHDITSLLQLGDLHRVLKSYATETILFHVCQNDAANKTAIFEYLQARENIDVFITADDFKISGLKPSPLYSQLFFELEIEVLNKTITSKEDALQWLENYVRKLQ